MSKQGVLLVLCKGFRLMVGVVLGVVVVVVMVEIVGKAEVMMVVGVVIVAVTSCAMGSALGIVFTHNRLQ